MYKVIKVQRSKSLDQSLKLVKNRKEITKVYYHLGINDYYYVYHLDKYSIVDIDFFINKKLIFVKK